MKIDAYILTYGGKPVRLGSYKTAYLSEYAPSVYFDYSCALRASRGRWINARPQRVDLDVRRVTIEDADEVNPTGEH